MIVDYDSIIPISVANFILSRYRVVGLFLGDCLLLTHLRVCVCVCFLPVEDYNANIYFHFQCSDISNVRLP